MSMTLFGGPVFAWNVLRNLNVLWHDFGEPDFPWNNTRVSIEYFREPERLRHSLLNLIVNGNLFGTRVFMAQFWNKSVHGTVLEQECPWHSFGTRVFTA